MNELLYWIIEYIKVLFSYAFLMYIWPSAIFRKFLKGKSNTFRFGFCVTVQVVLVSSVVLMLGLLHILNKWTMWGFFYGLLIWSFRKKFVISEDARKKFKYLVTGTYGWKHLLVTTYERAARSIKKFFKNQLKYYKKHWVEYTMLLLVIIYCMIYFSWGAFQEKSYGFSDIPVHHSWIYGLIEGKPFSAGIYPEGMHCIVYALSALTGVRVYSLLLFIGGINIISIIVSIYCLGREIFHWRYSAIFSLVILFTINMTCLNQITAMSRLQCALPQEFGFPSLYLCAVFLIRYLRKKLNYAEGNRDERLRKKYLDDDLLVFCMALAGTIIIHFYATFMAFFLCLGIAVILLPKIFTKERFLPLVCAAFMGVLIAVIPMVIGFASGIRLQGSLYWGMSLIRGSEAEVTETVIETQDTGMITGDMSDRMGGMDMMEGVAGMQPETTTSDNMSPSVNITQQEQAVAKQPSVLERLSAFGEGIIRLVKEKANVLYQSGYLVLFPKERANGIILITGLLTVFSIVSNVIILIVKKVIKKPVSVFEKGFGGYLMILISSVLYIVVYAAPALGLPNLVEGSRTCFIGVSLIAMVMTMVFDVIFGAVEHAFSATTEYICASCVVIGIVALICLTGNYHGYLYYELIRYEASVRVTNDIIDSLPPNTYTIISPTEEFYQVIEYGRHEELLTFLQNQQKNDYRIPTEYVFLYVEKKPLKYVQCHFFAGPKWLGTNKYAEAMPISSLYPEYIYSTLSDEYAQMPIQYFGNASGSYVDLGSRTIVESKAYDWCKQFVRLYPNEMKVLYEDEYFVCYYFKQNTYHLYNLAIQ